MTHSLFILEFYKNRTQIFHESPKQNYCCGQFIFNIIYLEYLLRFQVIKCLVIFIPPWVIMKFLLTNLGIIKDNFFLTHRIISCCKVLTVNPSFRSVQTFWYDFGISVSPIGLACRVERAYLLLEHCRWRWQWQLLCPKFS